VGVGLGDRDLRDVVTRRHGVGAVDQARVGLTLGDARQHGLDVDLLAGRRCGDGGLPEHGGSDGAARCRRGADDVVHAGVVQVGQRLDAGRVVGRGDEREAVADEGLGRAREGVAGPGERHRVRVGRGEHLSRCPVGCLLGERGRRAEHQLHIDVRVVVLEALGELGERLGEARRGEHGDRPLVRTAAAPGEGEQQGGREEPPHWGTSTTTLVDLTLAMARTPGSRPSSSAASLLISETTR
jgi:hypothetical protein